jgi:exonuclease III
MSHWQKSDVQRKDAWEYLRSLQPDFALLQETVPPDDFARSRCIYRPGGIGGNRRWGSAVVSFTEDVHPLETATPTGAQAKLELHQTYPGSLAIAATESGLTLVSVYAVMDHGYAITTLHKQISDLTPLFDSKQGKRVILGGDLNISTQFEEPHRTRHRNALERLSSLGLVDCLGLNRPPRPPLDACPCGDRPCMHVQTQRHARSKAPWQNDYMFVSRSLVPEVRLCRAIAEGNPWAFSDHCPVVVEF